MQTRATKEEVVLSFSQRPTYDALVAQIEQASTKLNFEHVNFSIRRGGEPINPDTWDIVAKAANAIKLAVNPSLLKILELQFLSRWLTLVRILCVSQHI